MTYRQRLRPAGWIGLALLLIAPFAAAYAWSDGEPMIAAVCGSLLTIGAVMVLIGREYYDAAAEIEEERIAAQVANR